VPAVWSLNAGHRTCASWRTEAVLDSQDSHDIRLDALPPAVRERVTLRRAIGFHAAGRRVPGRTLPRSKLCSTITKRNIAGVARESDRQWSVVWLWSRKSGFDLDKYRSERNV
jgi:hypothetical protein